LGGDIPQNLATFPKGPLDIFFFPDRIEMSINNKQLYELVQLHISRGKILIG
jgi:hypothetical protein